ncbi:sirohydrochlorin cobaltochelatase [Acidianus sulfidivorans JP7]|uniref:Sirohydrochlorin cobaltochelatase n=1 Tax=Acidianus sulfidivorans JP7 TaxID=619593 RepID=A0A2U9IMC5_9CREN|nr:CbiX/SirB N-terminal domain-containing protein [Acidianus sulfidivorans]AWR97171.1 sirohydrochlorin cobaltochelatase [Acidianus sulfidivorans JP7]
MIGVILVLHGSRIDEWKDVATQYKKLLENYFPLVEYGFLEFNKPDLKEALQILVNKGANEIIAVPLLFAAGVHFYKDIPRLLGINDEGTTTVNGNKIKVTIARPIGIDKRVAEILKERVEEAIESNRIL